MKKSLFGIALLLAGVLTLPGRAQHAPTTKSPVEQHLATFDDLDYNVFTHQKWDELKKSHSKDIVVHWPDGRQTKGIDQHIADLKAMFVYAPDTRILVTMNRGAKDGADSELIARARRELSLS